MVIAQTTRRNRCMEAAITSWSIPLFPDQGDASEKDGVFSTAHDGHADAARWQCSFLQPRCVFAVQCPTLTSIMALSGVRCPPDPGCSRTGWGLLGSSLLFSGKTWSGSSWGGSAT
eukprot:105994-Rhodomonas_salina.1